ncbi:MAG: DegV family protein [Ruminococcaceae bacterium]|nr:DegV family protein [Oscillospiraceae bacterium]
MGKNVLISADSTCDMTPALLEKYRVNIIPLYISFGSQSYRDGIEMTPDELYKKYETEGILPKTSAVSIGDFIEYFGALLKEADQVIHFSLSSGLSCTYQNAVLAGQEFPGRVFVLDSKNLSTGQALSIIHAAELLAAGKTAEEIAEILPSYIERVDASFIIESLEFLHKGGRCSALTALGANLLGIKPCIEVRDGKMDVGKKYRGKFRAVLNTYVNERLKDGNFETDRAFVTHAGCPDELVEMVRQAVEEKNLFREVLVTRAGCTISAHCGPNTLGVLFVRSK